MKKFEKIVPVLASGLVVAGLGTVDAFAVDEPDTQVQADNPPAETQQSETSNSSTEIKNVTTTTPPEQTETGGTATEGVVNLDVDSNGDLQSDGSLTVTTTPVDSTTSDPSTTVTTNPDGSTTTTTTTTTTEESKTEIEGEVNGGTGTPSQEDQGKVEENLNDSKDQNGNYDWNDFKNKVQETYGDDAKVDIVDNDNGSHTVTIEQTTSKPLTESELSVVLGGVELNKNEDGTYTYTKDGATVTVKVTEDTSTETTTTKWTVTVTETTKPSDDQVVTPGTDITVTDGGTDESKLVKDILDKVQNNQVDEKDVTLEDGKVTKVVDGSKTYEFTYTPTTVEPTKVDISKLSDEELNALLPSEGKYENKDGKIFQTIGDVVRELTFDSEKQTLTVTEYTISVTVTDTQGKTQDQVTKTEEEIEQAKRDATVNAVVEAIVKAIKDSGANVEEGYVKAEVEKDKDGNNSWSVSVEIDNKVYTYTVISEVDEETGELVVGNVREEHKNILVPGGSTTTISGNAYVTDGKVVWSGTEGETSDIIKVENGKGSVNYTEGEKFDGADVTADSIERDNEGRITKLTTTSTSTNADGNEVVTTKVYTFTYDVDLTDDEKAGILKQQGAEGATLEGLSKITWTIAQTDVTKVPVTGTIDNTDDTKKGNTASTGNLPDGVTQENGNYVYNNVTLQKDDKNSTDNRNVYTGKNTETGETYTIIEETSVPLADSSDIQSLISQEYTVPAGFSFDKIEGNTAIYKNIETGATITINLSNLTQTAITLKVSENHQITGSSESDVQAKIAEWMLAEAKKDPSGSVSFEGYGTITSTMTIEEVKQIVVTADKAINHTVDFTEMDDQELIALLRQLEKDSVQTGKSYIKTPTNPDDTQNYYDVWIGTSRFEDHTTKTFNGVTYTYIARENVWKQGTSTKVFDRGNRVRWDDSSLSGSYSVQGNGYMSIPIPETNGDKNYAETGFHTELGHVDLVADSTLSKTEGSTVSSEDCVILGGGLEVWLNATAEGLINDEGSQRAPLSSDIDWDDQDGVNKGFWQYNRDSSVSQDYLDRTNKFYKVIGTVAYGLTHYDNENAARKAVGKNGVIGYVKVPKVENGEVVKDNRGVIYEYVTYTKTAELTTYGYLGAENNACHNDYDIKLGNLTLLKGGQKVTSVNQEVKVYSADIIKTTSTSSSTQSLTFGDIVTTTPNTGTRNDTEYSSGGGQQIAGNWTITQEKNVNGTKPDSDKLEEKWAYTGTGTGSYDSYKIYEATTEKGSATGTQYGGSLSYNYEVPADPIVAVTGETQTNRDIHVTLENTSVTTNSNSNTTTPSRGGDRTPTTPTPPVVDIPEEDPPLVDVPEEEPPLVDIPEEEPPLVDIPEEEPPLVDVPEEEPPLVDVPDAQPPKVTIPAQKVPLAKAPAPSTVDILDEEVPLADVPKTGESPASLLAAAAASLSVLGLGILKKREED